MSFYFSLIKAQWLLYVPPCLTLNNFSTDMNDTEFQTLPTSLYTHSVSVIQNCQLMFYCEIIDVCSEIHTKHINTVRTAQ
jgi:hypothetical protein